MKAVNMQWGENRLMPARQLPKSPADRMRDQLAQLQRQIDKLKERKDAAEANADAIKLLEEQMRTLQEQLGQAAIQEKQRELEEAAALAAERAEERTQKNKDGDEVRLSPEGMRLISSSQKFAQIKTLRKAQIDLKARGDEAGADRIASAIAAKSFEIQQNHQAHLNRLRRSDGHNPQERSNPPAEDERLVGGEQLSDGHEIVIPDHADHAGRQSGEQAT